MWRTFADAGHRRLIVVGVFASLADELPWVRDAVPGCMIRVVRLSASREVLRRRVERREIGSRAAAQLARTWAQLEAIAAGDPSLAVASLDTGDLDVPAVAAAVLQLLPWRSSR